MPKQLEELDEEEQTTVVMMVILEGLVAEFDPKFMDWYIRAKQITKDPADRMRVDNAFSEKVGELREQRKITTPAQELREKAKQIVKQHPIEMWFGTATQPNMQLH